MENVSLLTFDERVRLPRIKQKRDAFKDMIENIIKNYPHRSTNNMTLCGKAGSGKTTLIMEQLERLTKLGVINGYHRISGHVNPSGLHEALRKTSTLDNGLPWVLVLDDVDCFKDEGCLELLKSAFDTKSKLPTNREVTYMTRCGSGFKYNGYGIIITNDTFDDPSNIDVHTQAVLDRTFLTSVDFELKDMIIFTTSLIEDYLNSTENDMTEDEILSVVDLFNTDVRRFIDLGAFKRSNINYSIRLINKFVDSQRNFGDKWKTYDRFYKRLSDMADLIEKENAFTQKLEEDEEAREEEILNNTKVSANGVTIAKKLTELIINNPRTGMPYTKGNLSIMKKSGKLVRREDNHWYLEGKLVG